MTKNFRYIITRILCAIAIAITFWFLDTYCVQALQNTGPLNGLTISENGRFNDHRSTGSSSLGYDLQLEATEGKYYFAKPSSTTNLTYKGYGVSLTQCDMSFVKGNYYSVSYYFLDEFGSYYYHPFYTSMTNKLAISDSNQVSVPNFTYDTVNSDVQQKLVEGLGYVDVYTVIFKASQNGTCLLSAFSSNPSSSSDSLSFVGYTYKSLGSSQLSSSDIQNALNSSFNTINNNINAATGSIIGSIESGNNSVNSNINAATGSIIGSIESGNESLNSNIDDLKQKQDEAHETSKGIWGTLKFLVSSIGDWFSNLMSSIGDGFSGLIDGITSLFMGEEECGPQEVEKTVSVPVSVLFDHSSLQKGIYWNNGVKTSASHMYGNPEPIPVSRYADYMYVKIDGIDFKQVYSIDALDEDKNYIGHLNFSNTSYETVTNDLGTFRKYPLSVSGYPDSKVSYIVVSYNSYSQMTPTSYYLFIEPHDEVTTTTEDVCVRKGGLFGMITDLGSSIGKWFSNLMSSIGTWFSDLFGLFKDDDVSDVTDSSTDYFTNFDDKDYGFSDIVKMPLALINNISSASCSTLVLPLPFVSKNVELPCMYEVYSTYFGSFLTLYQTITFGIVAYWVCINLFRMVRNFKNPDSDEVEVFEL